MNDEARGTKTRLGQQKAELISNISVVRVSQRNMVIVTNVYELSLSPPWVADV